MTTPTIDPFDELASMFISERPNERAGGGAATQVEQERQATIDLLLVGHLPVRGGLWITPYADAVARRAGPVGLVRLDSSEPTVQLVRANRNQTIAPMHDLLMAMDGMADATSRWIVRPPHDAVPEDLIGCDFNRITLLSSADEAAVVAAYQVVKSWVRAAGEAGVDLPAVEVAIVGADEQRASIAFERIRRTSEARLNQTVTFACCLSQIDAGIESTTYLTFPDDAGITAAEVVAQIRLSPEPTFEPADDAASIETTPTGHDEAPDVIDDLTEAKQIDFNPAARGLAEIPGSDLPGGDQLDDLPPLPREAAHAAAEVEPPSWNPRPIEQQIGTTVSTMRIGPKPATLMESKPGATEPDRQPASPTGEQSLAKHIAGLRAIRPRCPRHESVELAVDGRGDLHLLAREDGLRDLAAVSTWAVAHRDLLRMACPNDQIGANASTHQHVFARQPLAVSDLHHTDYHLHVLAPVEVDGRTAWYCAPLNQPE